MIRITIQIEHHHDKGNKMSAQITAAREGTVCTGEQEFADRIMNGLEPLVTNLAQEDAKSHGGKGTMHKIVRNEPK